MIISGISKIFSLLLGIALIGCSDSGTNSPHHDSFTITKISGDLATVVAGHSQSTGLTVRLSDDAGAPIEGWRIVYTVLRGSASVSLQSPLTDADGRATATLTWGEKEGIVEVEATAFGTGKSVRFQVSATSAAVDSLQVLSKNLVGEPGLEIRKPLIVVALDEEGNPVANAIIDFTGNDADIAFADEYVVTGEDGRAENMITIGDATGDIQILISTDEKKEKSATTNIFSLGEDRIVFVRHIRTGLWAGYRTINVMNPDGSGQISITDSSKVSDFPDWSPDGKKIVYYSVISDEIPAEIKTMNFDGSDKKTIYTGPGINSRPSWSPSGGQIAFHARSAQNNITHIHTVNADGTGLRQLTSSTNFAAASPSWHPDGDKIVFMLSDSTYENKVYSINTNGTGLTFLQKKEDYTYTQAQWSKDGSKFLLASSFNLYYKGDFEYYLIDADGSNETQIYGPSFADVYEPSWTPDDKIIYAEWATFSLWIGNTEGIDETSIALAPDPEPSNEGVMRKMNLSRVSRIVSSPKWIRIK